MLRSVFVVVCVLAMMAIHAQVKAPMQKPFPNLMQGPGTVSGVVWWDVIKVKMARNGFPTAADICDATGVSVVVFQPVKGQPFPKTVQVGTTPKWAAVGPQPAGFGIIETPPIVGCVFTVSGVPIQTDLTVRVNPAPQFFKPPNIGNLPHAVGPMSLHIPGGSCASAPPQITTLQQLRSKLTYCEDGANNVVLELVQTNL